MESNGGSETRLYQDLLKHLPTTGRQRRVIEMGAFDGQSYSISWTLEYCLGWLAVLVEANPKMFDKIVGYRPNAHTLQLSASCATDDRNLEFMSMPYTGGKLIKSSGDREEAKKRGWYSASHCGPLEAYLLDLGLDHIDLWILDVEGAELPVLKTLDLNVVTVDVLVVEGNNEYDGEATCGSICPSRDELRAILTQTYGYLLLPLLGTSRRDELFLHPRVQCIPGIDTLWCKALRQEDPRKAELEAGKH